MPSMYSLTVPVLTRGLTVLSRYLDAAASHAKATGDDPAEVIAASLAPDMFSLGRQVQSACDNAKNGVGRLTDTAVPRFPDDEKTFSELKERIDRTIGFLAAVPPAQFHGAEERQVVLKFGGVDWAMTGEDYVTQFLLPNFFFHVATAHGILRHLGLNIGKRHYLGRVD
jgi:uncharacterized protein